MAPDAELVAAGHHRQLLPQRLLTHGAHLALLMQRILCVSLIMQACDAFMTQMMSQAALLNFLPRHTDLVLVSSCSVEHHFLLLEVALNQSKCDGHKDASGTTSWPGKVPSGPWPFSSCLTACCRVASARCRAERRPSK